MALLSPPRVSVPARVARGEIFQVRAVIGHRMETGLRRDADGKVIPREIINSFVCRYGGVVAVRVDLREAVAANPFIEFHLRATTSARLEFTWTEDGGGAHTLAHDLIVT